MAEVYENPDIQVDSDELADEQFAYLEENWNGWTPASGNLDTWILEVGARLGSEVGTLALIPPPAIWRTYGEQIVRFLPIDATPATALSTWTLGDAEGHTIEAGTVVAVNDVPFEVSADRIVPPGETVAEGVEIVALDEGSFASGLNGPPTLEDSTVGYTAVIVLDAPTSGGSDGETDEEYADRLAVYTELFSAMPLTASDVEKFARLVQGVDRMLVLDTYRPATAPGGEAEDVPLTFTVVPIDSSGQPPAAGVLNELMTLLISRRGMNWNIWSMEPTYTIFDVNFEAVAFPEFNPVEVNARAQDSIEQYLSPANFGVPLLGERRRWVLTTEMRHRELATVLNNVEGLDNVTLLEFGIQGAPTVFTENVDIPMPGKAPLPMPGAITGSTVAP